ncbi:MAG: hypothetical protein HYT41_02565 [Candidatus Sungbacteria bacterium]|nr:hypothetical protein [Candidatus Sungbacteria bacterium]
MKWTIPTLNIRIITTFSIGFLLGFLIGLPRSYWNLIPIDWNGIGAIATFSAVFFAFYQHRRFEKKEKRIENREILESISPLTTDLKEIINGIPEMNASQFRWMHIKRGDPSLAYRMDPSIRQKIEVFEEENRQFSNRFSQLIINLSELFYKKVESYLRKRGLPDDARALETIDQNGREYFVRSLRIVQSKRSIQEGTRSIGFLPLIFYSMAARKYVETIWKDQIDLARETIALTYKILDAPIEESALENIMDSIRQDITDNPRLTKDLESLRNFHAKTKTLLKTLETYIVCLSKS